jgi:SAM-dependent methyltransferase
VVSDKSPVPEIPADDYRLSHLAKGGEYDSQLASQPFSIYMGSREQEILDRLIPSLFPNGIPRYLDFACGTGRISEVVRRYATESVGVDVSETMLAKARLRCPTMSFIRKDVTAEQLSLGQFDLITAFRFFGNAQDELRLSALRAIHTLLADDGYFILNNHRNPWSALALIGRFTGVDSPVELTALKLRRLLHGAGFRIVSSHGFGAWLVRNRLLEPRFLESSAGRLAERLSRLGLFLPWSPDAIIVARKQ